MSTDTQDKWDRIYLASQRENPQPCQVLAEHSYLLPDSGIAIDIACGLGGNAVFLAQHGMQTLALDISPVAIEKVSQCARNLQLQLNARVEDIGPASFQPESADVIVVSNYLDRELCNTLQSALSPGGLIYYQTFVRDKVDIETGPSNPHFLLHTNELLQLFTGLMVRVFVDNGVCGNTAAGVRNQSCIVAQKTAV